MNKKAFLLGEETIKMIVAVLCILFLVYLLANLYFTQTKKNKLSQAEASLSMLFQYIDVAVTQGEGGVSSFPVVNPVDWLILSFSQGAEQPEACKGDCICICFPKRAWQTQITRCNTEGVCKDVDGSYELNSATIKIPYQVTIEYKNNKISLT